MAMEVMIPTTDFDFSSAHPSPYSSPPSTPKRFGAYHLSAPSSPTHLSGFYQDFDDFCVSSPIPFDGEENPDAQKFSKPKPSYEDEFAFDHSVEREKTTLPAEELFESGKIRRSKQPPSRLGTPKRTEKERGRERNPSPSTSSSVRRGARSQSPRRVSKYPWEEETKQSSSSIVAKTSSLFSSSFSKNGSRKWRLKDFFLFRSASEGRAADKDPLKKYMGLFRKRDDGKMSSFRYSEGGSNSGSSSKRRGAVSAHELHYTMNRAVSEDLKKKTFLPYKQGIVGKFAFNPAVHALANGFGFSKK